MERPGETDKKKTPQYKVAGDSVFKKKKKPTSCAVWLEAKAALTVLSNVILHYVYYKGPPAC